MDNMTKPQMQKLCALLNAHLQQRGDTSGLVWEPDPSAIGGGIHAQQGTVTRYRVRRDGGRARIDVPTQDRPRWLGQWRTFTGREWVERLADQLPGAIEP